MVLGDAGWVHLPITRRRTLQVLTTAATALALRPSLFARAAAPASNGSPYGFLTTDELAILDSATAVLLPADDRPGAREIGVVGYIQSLLSFLPGADANCDRWVNVADVSAVEGKALGQYLGCPDGGDVNGDESVDWADMRAAEAAVFRARPMFAGGPFSGRHPQPHLPIGDTSCNVCHGVSGEGGVAAAGAGAEQVEVYPPNAFRQFLPLNRLQTLSWKVRILGPQSAPEEVANNPLLAELPEVDLRSRYREGLASLEAISQQRFGARFVDLSAEQQGDVLERADLAFVNLLQRHVIQGTFCAPEYGGNRNQIGWQLTGFDGDSQPLGYEIYDESVPGFYRERADKPNSGPNPDEDCTGFSDGMKDFLEVLSTFAQGRPLADPYCFEVDR